MRGGPAGTLFMGPTAAEGPETEGQPRNQLQTPRGEEFSEWGTNFLTLSSTFFQGYKHFSRVALAPRYPPIYGPAEGTIECLLFPHSK